MNKIATSSDLITQLSALKERVSSEPVSRDVVASELRSLADKISADDSKRIEEAINKDFPSLERILTKAMASWKSYQKDPKLDSRGKSSAIQVAYDDFFTLNKVVSRIGKAMQNLTY